MRSGALLVLFALVLAGCIGDGPEDGPEDGPGPVDDPGLPMEDPRDRFAPPGHACVRDDVQPRLFAPDIEGDPWRIGQWWQYDFTLDGVTRQTRLVYFEDQDFDPQGVPQHYMVGTAAREDAVEKAIYSTNPMVGRVHRAIYSPHESGEHADMFNFPLCDGSTWTTIYFGETFSLTARSANLTAGSAAGPGYRIEGVSVEGGRITIEYLPDVQWFTLIDVEQGNGRTLRLELTDQGAGHSGAAYFLRGQNDVVVDLATNLPVTQTAFDREDGREGAYETIAIGIRAEVVAPVGVQEIRLLDPAGEVAHSWTLGAVVGVAAVDEMVEVPYQEGEWVVFMAGVPGAVEGTIHIVSVYDRSGSV